MITFIDDHRHVYGVEPICRVLPIAPSTYYTHVARRVNPGLVPPRAQRDRMLKDEIRRVWEENFQVYGADKVWTQLKREGIVAARCTVERLMKQMGLRGVVRGKTVRTTVSDGSTPCPKDLVNPTQLSICTVSNPLVKNAPDSSSPFVDCNLRIR
ncbi:putative transposase [Paraburkholderia sp. UCT70]